MSSSKGLVGLSVLFGVSCVFALGLDIPEASLSAADANRWAPVKQAPDSPPAFHEVALNGTGGVEGDTRQARLIVGCRTDDRRSRWVKVQLPFQAMNFEFDPFEGPGGIGEETPLATLEGIGKEARFPLSGTYQVNDTFEFAWTPGRSEWTAWGEARNTSVSLLIASPAKGAPLRMAFQLPPEPAGSVLPCMAGSR